MNRSVYMDHNASTPVLPDVIEAMASAMRDGGNPSSVHASGRRARQNLDQARTDLARATGCKPGDIIFTSGGTEANNMALRGPAIRSIVVSKIEHDSVLAAARNADLPVLEIDVDHMGRIQPDSVETVLGSAPAPALVSVMLANNEIGTIQPVAKIVSIAKKYGALVHCDAIQAFGKIPVSMNELGVDLMSVSAHKIGGPPGVGALIVREGVTVTPIIYGGGQEMRRRSGTENLPGIIGFGKASELVTAALDDYGCLAILRDRLENGVTEIAPECRIVAREADRLANTSNIVLPGMKAETQVMALDLEGICVSSGAACSSGKVQPSHVLAACGASPSEVGSAIRVSLGPDCSEDDIDAFLSAYRRMVKRLRLKCSDAA